MVFYYTSPYREIDIAVQSSSLALRHGLPDEIGKPGEPANVCHSFQGDVLEGFVADGIDDGTHHSGPV